MWKLPKNLLLAAAVSSLASACTTVKPYQRQYLNDDTMQLGATPVEKSEGEAVSYREGASGGDFGKTGGGCGCN